MEVTTTRYPSLNWPVESARHKGSLISRESQPRRKVPRLFVFKIKCPQSTYCRQDEKQFIQPGCATPSSTERAMLTRIPPLKSRVIPSQAGEPKLSQIEARAEYSGSQWNDLLTTRHIDLSPPPPSRPLPPFVSVHRTEYPGDRYTKTDSPGITRTWLKCSWSKCIGREYCSAIVKRCARNNGFQYVAGQLIEISRRRLFSPHGARQTQREITLASTVSLQ